MLIEQTIEFELSGRLPPGRTYITKIKITNKNFREDYYLLLKHSRRQCNLLSPTWAKSLTKSNTKIQHFKRALDLNCK